ncbi:PREDICTED: uncharacterized protein LOC109215337 [Nicotiana attenuata]|uniref:uncharacterized protein LOC109215337 n=1 Tax=Nicotiana attenuata TaxID=49451 RepID=UPI000905CEB0|nr:PREDICTED: uncharacterized protein LOC109215337 [Nicotiana attenuata]
MANTLDHNHALYLHPSDTTGAPIVSIQLTGSDNYSIWSRAMRIQLLGKNKLGLIDGTLKREDVAENLGHQWDKCNAIVLGWIMSSVSKKLVTGIVYAKDACRVWEDLKERFDKINASRIYQLHKEIATLCQGTNSVSTYFTKLKELWDEYESMIPACRDREFVEHLHRQKLMQFLMGLNENYEQARSQILMTNPTPNVSKAYAMIIEREIQRAVSNVTSGGRVEATDKGYMTDLPKPPQFTADQYNQIMMMLNKDVPQNTMANMDLLSGRIKGIGKEKDGLYLFLPADEREEMSEGLSAQEKELDVSLWHRRLTHASGGAMRAILGLPIENCRDVIDKCDVCPLAKHTRLPFHSSDSKSTEIFQLLHLDVWGPYSTSTVDGNKYFLTIVDDYSRVT